MAHKAASKAVSRPEGRSSRGRSGSGTTLYVVCYDVVDDRRRAKVHAVLSGFGTWRQYSLFECFVTRQELVLLRARLAEVMNQHEDSVRLYAMCDGCRRRVEVVGRGEAPREEQVYIL